MLEPIRATAPPGGKGCFARSVSIPTRTYLSQHSAERLQKNPCCGFPVTTYRLCCAASQLSVSRSVSTGAAVCDPTCAPVAADSPVRFARGG